MWYNKRIVCKYEENNMEIRRAKVNDMEGINQLLFQVLEIHHKGRPDLFKGNTKKYTNDELLSIISNDETPIFVAINEEEKILGYAFCIFQCRREDNILTDIKTLYIDDLCVDETRRGQQIGKKLYEYVVNFAKKKGCYNVTLNVWECNEGAKKFYESCGLVPQKIGMEYIIKED